MSVNLTSHELAAIKARAEANAPSSAEDVPVLLEALMQALNECTKIGLSYSLIHERYLRASDQRDALEADVVRLTAERDALRAALTDALEGMEDMRSYVPEFFADKWEHDAYIARARTALISTPDCTACGGTCRRDETCPMHRQWIADHSEEQQ